MLDDLFGGGGSATYRTFSDLSPETQSAFGNINERSMQLSREAGSRGEMIYGQNAPALQRAVTTGGDMQNLSAGVANREVARFAQEGEPIMARLRGRNVLSDTQRSAAVDKAVGDFGAKFGQAEGQYAQQAARAAAKYGVAFDPQKAAASAAARVGGMNAARAGETDRINQNESAYLNMLGQREAMGLQSGAQASVQGGRFVQQVGGVQDVALGGADAATRAMGPAAGLTGQMVGSEFGQSPMVDEGDGGLFGAIAPVAMMGAGIVTGNPMLFAAGAGAGARRRADGGRIGYANGGAINPNEFEFFPGSGVMASYADGGEVEDGEYSMVRADGATTQGDGSGGTLQGPGSGISDDIPAITDSGEPIRVANGEYVVPKDVVDLLGEDFFDSLVEKFHTPAAIQREQGAA